MKKISILLADDHRVLRAGLRALLEYERDFAVIGEADSGRQAVQMAIALRPTVVLMEIVMPLMNGLEATQQLAREAPGTRVLVLSAFCNDDLVQQAILSGAAGYLVKQSSPSEVIEAIRRASQGIAVFSPSVAHRPASGPPHLPACTKNRRLTAREREVLRLVAEGLATKQIASELRICIKTVEKHRHQIMERLNIRHVAGLTRYALTHGLVEHAEQRLYDRAVEGEHIVQHRKGSPISVSGQEAKRSPAASFFFS